MRGAEEENARMNPSVSMYCERDRAGRAIALSSVVRNCCKDWWGTKFECAVNFHVMYSQIMKISK